MRHTDMRRIRITNIPGQADTILALHAAGVSGVNIARYVGREPNVIWRWIRRQGLSRYPRMTAAIETRIEGLYYEGLDLDEIAAQVGYDPSNVRECLKRRDLYLSPYRHMTAEDDADVLRRYQRGERVVNIAARLGYSPATVYKALARRGVTALNRAVDGERILALYSDGMNIRRIAAAVGCSSTTVRRHLQTAGVYDVGRTMVTTNTPGHPWRTEYHGPKGARS